VTTGDDFITPYTISITADFGYNSTTGTIETVNAMGAPYLDPVVTVTIYDERYYDSYNELYSCVVSFWIEPGSPAPAWLNTDITYFDSDFKTEIITTAMIGISDEYASSVEGDCGLDFDPLYGDIVDFVGTGHSIVWGDLNNTPEYLSGAETYFGDYWDSYSGHTLGTFWMIPNDYGYYTTDFAGVPMGFGFGYEVDEDMALVLEDSKYFTPIQSGEVAATGPSAYYSSWGYYGYYTN
jgi:hypothetical protein